MLILHSASPRRKEILKSLGLEFQILPSSSDESERIKETPLAYLKRVTFLKLGEQIQKENFHISSDTIVVLENRILHKVNDFEDAKIHLKSLSGKVHTVFSSLGMAIKGEKIFEYEQTKIVFNELSEQKINEYLEKFKPFDKAGSYGIQDDFPLVKSIEGSYTNVLGFPIRRFFRYHREWSQYLNQNI
jgi:septum formation protein